MKTSNLRRSSRLARRAGDRSDLADIGLSPQQTHWQYLPPELTGLVAKCLYKFELKNLRFVSKQWNAMATPLLFDMVYVSPRDKDLQAFSNIAKHPVLRRSIKEMICDISEIPELSHEDYFHNMCYELRDMTFQLSEQHPFKGPHTTLDRFVNEVIRDTVSQPTKFSRYGN